MKDKKNAEKKEEQSEMVELDDEQASQVKGGHSPLIFQSLTNNENIDSTRDSTSGLATGKKRIPT